MAEIDVQSDRGRKQLLQRIRGAEPKELIDIDDAVARLQPSPARDAVLEALEAEVRRRDAHGPQRNAFEREQELAVRNGDGKPDRFSTRTTSVTPRERFGEALSEDRSTKARKAAQVRWSGKREEGGARADE